MIYPYPLDSQGNIITGKFKGNPSYIPYFWIRSETVHHAVWVHDGDIWFVFLVSEAPQDVKDRIPETTYAVLVSDNHVYSPMLTERNFPIEVYSLDLTEEDYWGMLNESWVISEQS